MTAELEQFTSKLFSALTSEGMSGFTEIFDENIEIDLPYNTPSAPAKLSGREQAAGFLAAVGKFIALDEIKLIDMNPTEKGVILRYTATGKASTTGKPYKQHYVGFFELKNGLITRWTDYFNTLEVYYTTLDENWRAQPPSE